MLSIAALSAASLLTLAFAPAQYFGRQQDEILYLVAAQALASGRYCHLTVPGCPPLVAATPGFPLLLAPLAFFTERPGLFQVFAALLGAAVPWAAWWWLRRRLPPAPALLAALLAGSSPLLLSQAGAPMSETPYLLLCLLFLAAVEDGKAGAAGWLWLALTQMRPAGLSLAPALLRWAGKEQRRGLARSAAPALLGALAWSLWSRSVSGSVQEGSELVQAYAGRLGRLALVAIHNALASFGALGGSHLPPAFAYGAFATALGAALVLAALAGCAALLRRRREDPGALALLGALAMHLVWPYHYERYLIPLLPLLWRAAAEALGRRAAPALGALLALQLLFQVGPRLGRPGPWTRPELAGTYAWLAAAEGTWTLASALPLRDGWWSGRPSISIPQSPDAASLALALKAARVRFVLLQDGLDLGLSDPARAPDTQALAGARRLLEGGAPEFRLAADFPSERTRVYEVR